MIACRLFRCDLPRVFDWRNSLPIVRLFLSNLRHSRCYIYIYIFIIFITCQLSQSLRNNFVLFDPYRGPYQLLPLKARVDLGAMAIKGNPHSPKPYWNLTIRLFCVIPGHSLGESYPSAEKQSVYSTAPPDWAMIIMIKHFYISIVDLTSLMSSLIDLMMVHWN